MRNISLITTGGTIEKTYDERTGVLSNNGPIVERMLADLRLEDTTVRVVHLLRKDSLAMTEEDRVLIVGAVRDAWRTPDTRGVLVLHGTDTLCLTGQRLLETFPEPPGPIVLTGAMRPFEMKHSDALQNLTEAVFAAGVLPTGVYCVAHGRALRFPGVRKDPGRGTFVQV